MTKEQYKERLRQHGYRIDGDYTHLDTRWGDWIQKIVSVPDFDGWGLVSVHNPCMDEEVEA